MHFTSNATGGLSSSQSSYSPSNRGSHGSYSWALSQLSGVRRSAGGQLNSSGPSFSVTTIADAAAAPTAACPGGTATAGDMRALAQLTQAVSPLQSAIHGNNQHSPNTEKSSQQTIQNSQFLLTRLNDPKMSETERSPWKVRARADRSLFVKELLLSTLVCEESSSSGEDERGKWQIFGATGCVDIIPLDVALENLIKKWASTTSSLMTSPIRRQCPLCCICQWKWTTTILGLFWWL